MGVYMSKPRTDKKSQTGFREDGKVQFGLTSMQGWRRSMEDAHVATSKFIEGMELYGVFDGHGGPAVSKWVSLHFQEEFSKNLANLRTTLKERNIPMDYDFPCLLEEAILKPRETSGQNVLSNMLLELSENEDGNMREEDGTDKLIYEDPEESKIASEFSEDVALVCEALQETFLSLDERMRAAEGRAELKAIHQELKDPEDNEEDSQSEIHNMLRMYLNISSKSGAINRIVDDADNKKSSFPFLDGPGFLWGDDDDDDEDDSAGGEDQSNRIEEIDDTESHSNDDDSMAKGPPSEPEGDVEMPHSAPVEDSSFVAAKDEVDVKVPSMKAGSEDNRGLETRPTANVVSAATAAPPAAAATPPSRVKPTPAKKQPGAQAAQAEESSSEEEETDAPPAASLPAIHPDEPENCGTTAVVAVVVGGPKPALVCANAGDSRVVLSRGETAIALSRDHKPNLLRETNRIKSAGGQVVQGRVDGNLNLSRSIGDLAYKADPSIPAEAQRITAFPDVRVIPLHKDDRFAVIACDGIWDCMKNQEMVDFVSSRLEAGKGDDNILTKICEEICDHCIAENPLQSEGIGCDNMTVMIVMLEGQTYESPAAPSQQPHLYASRLYQALRT